MREFISGFLWQSTNTHILGLVNTCIMLLVSHCCIINIFSKYLYCAHPVSVASSAQLCSGLLCDQLTSDDCKH